MNLLALSIAALVCGSAGAFLVGDAAAAGNPFMPAGWCGFGLLLLGGGAQVLAFVTTKNALGRFRRWCDEASADASPPRLPGPFGAMVHLAQRLFRATAEERDARTAEARRSRITARSLQSERDVLERLLQSMLDGVVLVDPLGTPTFVNRAARRMFGLPRDGELDGDLREQVHVPALKVALEKAIRGEGRDCRESRDVDCSDQSQRQVLRMSFQRVAVEEGAAEAEAPLAVLLRDVTRDVELNRMKSDFASSVSHELKTPLCSMRAFLEMLADGDIDGEEEQKAHVTMILDETDRLTRLVQNLLNLSRLESGITKMERSPVDLRRLLAHLEDVLTPLATARKQALAFELSDYLPAVTGDQNLLEQAVMNLVSNAIKYTPEGGSIRVRAGIGGREVQIEVSDTGVGIPEKALALVFEKFTRIENHAGLKATGTGLGLPLAKFVAESHGGRITVASEVGKGSTFTMYMPARRAEEDSEAQLVGLEEFTG